MNSEIQNAVIERTQLGYMDRDILSVWIFLDYGGLGQGFGGYVLDGKPASGRPGREPALLPGVMIAGLLKTLEISTWEALPKSHVRVRREPGFNGRVTHIGHFLKDQWFSFEEAFQPYLKEAA
jgi:hypothetical protein